MSNEKVTVQGKYLIYKGYPLVRENNVICYGDMNRDKCMLFLMIMSSKTIDTSDPNIKLEIPDSIIGQIIYTDPNITGTAKIAKQFEKNGLYDALDIGLVLLERYNKK